MFSAEDFIGKGGFGAVYLLDQGYVCCERGRSPTQKMASFEPTNLLLFLDTEQPKLILMDFCASGPDERHTEESKNQKTNYIGIQYFLPKFRSGIMKDKIHMVIIMKQSISEERQQPENSFKTETYDTNPSGPLGIYGQSADVYAIMQCVIKLLEPFIRLGNR